MAKEIIRVEGLRQIAEAAKKLNAEVQKKIAGNALVAGARIVRDAARSLAPVLRTPDPRRRPGTIRRKLVAVRTRKGDFPEEVTAIVGVRLLTRAAIKKFKQGGRAGSDNPDDPFYWWYVEAGTRAHAHRRKSIPGVRFLKRAFEGNAERAAKEIRDRAGRDIVKYGNSLAR